MLVPRNKHLRDISISAQLQTLRQYANLYKREIVDEYVDEFQAVLVRKFSRLSRNMLDTLTLLDKFEDYGVKFISYSKNFDTSSPIGRLVVQLMALLPKWNEIHCLRTLSLV